MQKDIRSDFEEFRPYLAANRAEILQTQSDFCRSVAEANIDLMRSLWNDSPESMCFKVTENCFSAFLLLGLIAIPRCHVPLRNGIYDVNSTVLCTSDK